MTSGKKGSSSPTKQIVIELPLDSAEELEAFAKFQRFSLETAAGVLVLCGLQRQRGRDYNQKTEPTQTTG